MLKVGLTGGIGSGKSLVARIFTILGIPVFDADTEAKTLMETDPVLKAQLKDAFGEDVYLNGMLRRKKLAEMVFPDEGKLRLLNNLVHPKVRAAFLEWVGRHAEAPYVIQEAAILLESGWASLFDRVIAVEAPEPLRIRRVMERDGTSAGEVRSRMERQWTDEERRKHADHVLVNDEKELLIPAILELHRLFLNENQNTQ
ncbi:MAG TPA: dephospho-CoA kinase [Bacteroidetes bacterium]|nr:dephospho-CoA kinase [Bacteroidota bacterium]